VVFPVLFLVLLAAVRYLFTGTTPVGRRRGTHVTNIVRHHTGKLKKRITGLLACGVDVGKKTLYSSSKTSSRDVIFLNNIIYT
jgi:hypothetical protein